MRLIFVKNGLIKFIVIRIQKNMPINPHLYSAFYIYMQKQRLLFPLFQHDRLIKFKLLITLTTPGIDLYSSALPEESILPIQTLLQKSQYLL